MLTIRIVGERQNGPGTESEPIHHEGHACPNRNCGGYGVWGEEQSAECLTGTPRGHHTHQCPRCGVVWQHGPGRW